MTGIFVLPFIPTGNSVQKTGPAGAIPRQGLLFVSKRGRIAPGGSFRRGYLHQAGFRMGKEPPEGRAVIVSGLPCPVGDPVPRAAAKTQPLPSAIPAFCRALQSPPQKVHGAFALAEFGQRCLPQVSQLPVIQGKKVAGIHAAVPFHYRVGPASPAGGTGGRRQPHSQVHIVFKQADAGIPSLFPVPVPGVEKHAEKVTVVVRCEGPGTPTPHFPYWVQAGNELQVPPPVFCKAW